MKITWFKTQVDVVIWVLVLILTTAIWFSKITHIKIPSVKYVVLAVTMDNKLIFYKQLKNLCMQTKLTKRTASKLNEFTRIAPYLNLI